MCDACESKNTILLYDEEGNESEYQVVATLVLDENEYIILVPEDADLGDPEASVQAMVLKLEEDENGEHVLVGIEDEKELDEVIAAYEELMEQENN